MSKKEAKEQVDDLLEFLKLECYRLIELSRTTPESISLVKTALTNLSKETKIVQGYGIIDLKQVLFEVEDGAILPLSPQEDYDED